MVYIALRREQFLQAIYECDKVRLALGPLRLDNARSQSLVLNRRFLEHLIFSLFTLFLGLLLYEYSFTRHLDFAVDLGLFGRRPGGRCICLLFDPALFRLKQVQMVGRRLWNVHGIVNFHLLLGLIQLHLLISLHDATFLLSLFLGWTHLRGRCS